MLNSINISPIYEPAGRAREYSALALNLYRGCGHKCSYCYAPKVLRMEQVVFQEPKPRTDIIQKLSQGAMRLQKSGKIEPVLLCFTCDPYQPIDNEYLLTREAIIVLHKYDIPVHILTKGGSRARRDFDLLTSKDAFATTLTFLDNDESISWEPLAALPQDRIETIELAKKQGLPTWVSLEPVIDPDATLELIKRTHDFVDLFKVGTLNHHPLAATIDWHKFAVAAVDTLTRYNCKYYLKEDLRRWL